MPPTKFALEIEYGPIEGVEMMEFYRPGGYHPIRIGDTLAGRYQVIHKLGHGSSTIWLARDTQCAVYVAVKVGTANATSNEIENLHALSKIRSDNSRFSRLGLDMFPQIKDEFEIEGPNGNHKCHVKSPAQSSVKDAQSSTSFPIETARVIVAQLIIAVACMHNGGYVHGDIHPGNVLLRLPSTFDQLSVQELYQKYGEPFSEEVIRYDGQKILSASMPSHGILPVWLGKRAKSIPPSEARIQLTDFGETFSPKTEQRLGSECHAPRIYRPPEAIFEPERPLSYSCDIWCLACAIWPIFGLRSLFSGFLSSQDDIICQQIDLIGLSSFQTSWWNAWENRSDYFDNSNSPKGDRYVHPSFEDLFERDTQALRRGMHMDTFGADETSAILAMVRTMVVFRPERRATAESLMTSEWMLRWGLPELQKVGKV